MVSQPISRAPGEQDEPRSPATPRDELAPPRTEPEFRAQRLGSALRSLATELVDERRKVAKLRREVAELKSLLESRPPINAATRLEADPGAGVWAGLLPRTT